jgi:hypothetical protein
MQDEDLLGKRSVLKGAMRSNLPISEVVINRRSKMYLAQGGKDKDEWLLKTYLRLHPRLQTRLARPKRGSGIAVTQLLGTSLAVHLGVSLATARDLDFTSPTSKQTLVESQTNSFWVTRTWLCNP